MTFEELLKKHSNAIPKHMRDTESCLEVLRLMFNCGMLRAAEIAEERYNKIPLVDEITCDEVAYAIRRETEDGEPN